MGEARDRDGILLGTERGATKAEVFGALNERFPEAADIRVRSDHKVPREFTQAMDQAINQANQAEAPMRRLGSEITLDNVEYVFQYQPWTAEQQEHGQQVREALIAAAKTILRVVPAGPDRTVALRKLRECRMDCNSAITFYGRF